jgi:uncharacterized protein
MRKLLALSQIFCLFICLANAQTPVQDRYQSTEVIRMSGFLADKLQLAYSNRILTQNVDKLVAPFKNQTETWCWQTEFWGKWFTSAVLAYKYQPQPSLKLKLDKAVAELLATQSPDGYIGNYAPGNHLQAWDIWGRKYCLLGLLSYYELSKNEKCLLAARKLCDHLMKELKENEAPLVALGNHRGMAASSVMEPVCLLYNLTKDKKYLDFALSIVKQWETPEGPQLISKAQLAVAARFPKPSADKWYAWQQGQKAYEMMSCYEGLVELYRITGNKDYLAAVEATWQNIKDTEINIVGSGASMECWFGGKILQTRPIAHYQETCVTVTWIKLSHQLFRLTGQVKYADAIEQSYYNALLGSMTKNGGDWSKYTPLNGQRKHGSEQCGMGMNCCVASGPRALFLLPSSVISRHSKGIALNYFVSGLYKTTTPKKQALTIEQMTDYPLSGKVRLKLSLAKSEDMTIFVRIPAWSKSNTLQSVGKQTMAARNGEYMVLQGIWKNGDIVNLELDMKPTILRPSESPDFFAIQRGPLVFARDTRLAGPGVDEFIEPVLNENGDLEMETQIPQTNDFWVLGKAKFKVESYLENAPAPLSLELCDYASAGSTYGADSRFRVWFQALFDPRK